ncbi:MAG: ribonuclease E/G [Rubrimonas sp.]|uniref:ribonuclease E/G n=1 Tax=Rubrimonas sp. TaxID=2036015 RepID=UPI002FDE92A4
MKGRLIAVERLGEGAVAAALLVDGRLEDLLIDPPEADPLPRPEALHWARVERLVAVAGAAFARLGDGTTGWLRAPQARPGDMLCVQVARWPDPGKAPPLNERPVWKGRYALLTPGAPGANVARGIRGHAERARLQALADAGLAGAPDDLGLVIRTAAANADDAAIEGEIAELRAMFDADRAAMTGTAPKLLRPAPDAAARALRDWADPEPDAVEEGEDAFERLGVWDAIADLRRARVDLPGGGWMSVEATAAMIAVDVNTGEDFSKGAAQRVNLAACAELPRQLRLRGLGGVALIDFAPLPKGARQGVENALKRAFAEDPVDTTLAGWTPLGNFELTRKRERRPLREALRDG